MKTEHTDSDGAVPTRKPGFYHVKYDYLSMQTVGWWHNGQWRIPGYGSVYRDEDFCEIDERRITREAEQQQPDTRSTLCEFCGEHTDDCDCAGPNEPPRQPDELAKAQERIKELEFELSRLIYGYRISGIEALKSNEWAYIYDKAEAKLNNQPKP